VEECFRAFLDKQGDRVSRKRKASPPNRGGSRSEPFPGGSNPHIASTASSDLVTDIPKTADEVAKAASDEREKLAALERRRREILAKLRAAESS